MSTLLGYGVDPFRFRVFVYFIFHKVLILFFVYNSVGHMAVRHVSHVGEKKMFRLF